MFSAAGLEALYRRDNLHFTGGKTWEVKQKNPNFNTDTEKKKKITFSGKKTNLFRVTALNLKAQCTAEWERYTAIGKAWLNCFSF